MEGEAINQAISHSQKWLDVIGVRVIPQLQNSRRSVCLSALLNHEQAVRSRLGRDEDRLFPFDVRECFFDGVRQRRIRRSNQAGGRPRNSLFDTERWFIGGVQKWAAE